MKIKPSPKFWLTISLLICVVSMVGAALVQTNGMTVKVKDLRWETSAGQMMSALLFIPPNATEKTPAPAIVTSHGWYNNREMQDLNFVEYARRGYVVMSIDMYGHGNSDTLINSKVSFHATGMTDAVELIAALPYVDKTRIGVTGHSNGARAANWAVDDDNKKATPLIKAVLLVANDATYQDANRAYYNKYGNRHVGIVAAQFDEFFFRVTQPDGSRSAPKDYINQVTAQSFLNFGIDPAKGEKRAANTMYKQAVSGKDAIRVIYTPYQIHPWNHFSMTVVKDSVAFFEAALGAPNPIPGSNQIWPWKTAFNALGLVGICIFVISFTKILLKTKYFGALKTTEPVAIRPAPAATKDKVWLWVSLVVGQIFAATWYITMYWWSVQAANRPTFLLQTPVYYIGIYAIGVAVFFAILLLIGHFFFGGKNLSLKERGLAIGWKNLLKTALLSLAVCCGTYFIVFFADYLFKVDFRVWVIPMKAFTPDKIGQIILYMPFFLAFYVVGSIAANSYNFVKMGNKEWINTAVLAFFNGLNVFVMVAVQYIHFFATGKTFSEVYWGSPATSNIQGIWLFPLVIYLPLAVIMSRNLYKVTRNPYLGGFIFATIMTIMACTNTLTFVP